MGRKNKSKKGTPVRSPTPPAIANDDNDDLMNQLFSQLSDSEDGVVQAESAAMLVEMDLNKQAEQLEAQPKVSAKDRYKARQARKAAALAESYSPDDPAVQARLQKEAEDELEAIQETCNKLNLQIWPINPDGHCLFSAVGDQLALLGLLPPDKARYEDIRSAAANYIYTHPDDFIPFLPSFDGEDGYGAGVPGLMSAKEFEEYCKSVQNTAVWGGEPEILALSRAFGVPIHVIQGGDNGIVVHNPSPDAPLDDKIRPVYISYHRKLYGLGEHYNSLRPVVPQS